VNSYNYGFNLPSSTKEIDITNNNNIKFSDLSYTNPTYQYVGILNVSGSGTFTVNKNIVINNQLNVGSGGTFIASGSPTISISAIEPIGGRFIVPGATLNLNSGITSLSLIDPNSAIAYLNEPAITV